MNKIDNFITTSNLIFTDTIKREDLCRVNYDYKKETPNLENAISVYDLMKSFNDEYMRFKKDYEELGKIKLGKYNSLISVYNNKNNFKDIEIYVEKPIMTEHNFTYYNIIEDDGKIESFVTGGGHPYNNPDFYREEVNIENFPIKDYLDLFIQYKDLFEKYKYFKNTQMFGDGTFCMFSWMDKYNANILNKLNEWNISLGGSYFDGEDYIELKSSFKKNFKINEDKCKFVYDCENQNTNSYNDIAKKLYLNKKYTQEKHY